MKNEDRLNWWFSFGKPTDDFKNIADKEFNACIDAEFQWLAYLLFLKQHPQLLHNLTLSSALLRHPGRTIDNTQITELVLPKQRLDVLVSSGSKATLQFGDLSYLCLTGELAGTICFARKYRSETVNTIRPIVNNPESSQRLNRFIIELKRYLPKGRNQDSSTLIAYTEALSELESGTTVIKTLLATLQKLNVSHDAKKIRENAQLYLNTHYKP